MNAPSSLPGRAFRVLRRRLPALLGASVWPYLVLVGFIAIISTIYHRTHPAPVAYDPVTLWYSLSFPTKLGVILGFVAMTSIPYGLALAGVSLLVYEDYRGEESSLGRVLKRVIRGLLSVVLLSFLVGCGEVCGSFLLFAPGLIVAMLTTFAIPVLLLEDAGIAVALRRSFRLTWERIGTILGLMLALVVVWFLVGAIFFTLLSVLSLDNMEMAWAFRALLVVVLPVLICVYCTMLTILYYDIRVSRGELQAPIGLSG